MRPRLTSAILLFAVAPAPSSAQENDSGFHISRVLQSRECVYGPQDPEAIVVCGRRSGQPQGLPPREPDDPLYRAERSWGSRVQGFDQFSRDMGGTVGPFGYLQHGGEAMDRWREARRDIVRHRRW